MEKENKTILVEKKVIEYAFTIRKSKAGLISFANTQYMAPNCDGEKIRALLQQLPVGTDLYITCRVKE